MQYKITDENLMNELQHCVETAANGEKEEVKRQILQIAHLQLRNRLLEQEKYKNYSKYLEDIFTRCQNSICGIGQLGTAAYLLKLGTTKIAIDPALWGLDIDLSSRRRVIEELNDCDAVIVTHEHGDHFDPEVLSKVRSEKTKLLIPNFFGKTAVDNCIYVKENLISTVRGNNYYINDVRIHIFNSVHTPNDDESIPSSGVMVEYMGGQYVFTGDVRQYAVEKYPKFDNTKALFAHMWLGSTDALNLHDNLNIDKFCAFVNSFRAEKIYFGHMYDVRRTIDQMWGDVHYDIVKIRFPDSQVLRMGDWVEL